MNETPESQPETEEPAKPLFDRHMLEALVCPLTHGPLEYDAEHARLISRRAGRAFPIIDGIPIMLPDEALPLDEG